MRLPALASIALLLPALAACGSNDESSNGPEVPDDGILPPPAEGQGVQYQMRTHLEAGTEVERCKFVKAPPEGLLINRDQVRYTAGSHHVLLFETPYQEIPTKKEDGTVVDTGGVFDCSEGPTQGWKVERVIAGSQNADGSSVVSFPPDVALRVPPGAVLLMNAHYINASAEAIDPEVRVNLFTVPEEQVKQEGDVLFLYNIFIKVDPQSKGEARMRCPVNRDITLLNVQSHMHARGVDYAASINDGAPIYTNKAWADVPVKTFDGGLAIKKGDVLDYRCGYDNTEARAVYQGPRSTDEMCMMIGTYYPADRATAVCAADPARPGLTNQLGAEWFGSGEASCAETFACVKNSLASDDFMKSMIDCVAASDPAVSREVSESLRCFIMSLVDGKDAETACAAPFAACEAK